MSGAADNQFEGHVIDPIASAASGITAGDVLMTTVADNVANASTLQYRPETPVFVADVQPGGVRVEAIALSSAQAPVAPPSAGVQPAGATATAVNLDVDIPNVMLAADMVALNIALIQRAQTTYEASMALGASSAEQTPKRDVRPIDSATDLRY